MAESKQRAAFIAGLSASIALHGSLVFVLISSAPSTPLASTPLEFAVWSDLDPENQSEPEDSPTSEDPEPVDSIPPQYGGPVSVQNIDSVANGGGGDDQGATHVVQLTDRAHPVTLSDSAPNSAEASQTQRIRTARDRATQEDRRSTPNPNDQPFLASGNGSVQERRRVSEFWPAPGVARAEEASRDGAGRSAGSAAAPPMDGDLRLARVGGASAHPGGAPSPGLGLTSAQGRVHTDRAPVAHGRPEVDQGPAATPSEEFDRRVRDQRNAEQLASSLTQTWVEASQRSARSAGEGAGGLAAPGEQGSGYGPGTGTASAHSPGPGNRPSLNTESARYRTWHRAMRRQVERHLSFPRARALAMDQGVSIYRFRVRQNGTLVASPAINVPSSFDDLDHAGQQAIRRAAPFPPLPGELGPEHTVSLRIEHRNPMVQ